MHAPKNYYMKTAKHILRYLKETIGDGLLYTHSTSGYYLYTYTDADCAENR